MAYEKTLGDEKKAKMEQMRQDKMDQNRLKVEKRWLEKEIRLGSMVTGGDVESLSLT